MSSTSAWRYRGFTIWPVLDDETEAVAYYDIMGPCLDPEHRLQGHKCDCAIAGDPEDMAGSVEQARSIVRSLAEERRVSRRAFGTDPFVP